MSFVGHDPDWISQSALMLPRLDRNLIKGTPARYLGHVHTPDEKSAIEEAAKEFRVPDNLRNRIVVMRNDRDQNNLAAPPVRGPCGFAFAT